MRIAVVENGIVVNLILRDEPIAEWGEVALPDDSPVGIGWSYDGEAFAAPPAPPEEPQT